MPRPITFDDGQFKPAFEGKYGRGGLEDLFSGPLKWWFEATAEYAAGELVWPHKKKYTRNMGHGAIDPKLLNYGLTSTGKLGMSSEEIEYDRGYFIKYIMETKNKTKSAADIINMHIDIQKALVDKGMWKTENGLKPLDTYLRSTTQKNLWEWYRDFAGYFLFSSQRPNVYNHSPDDSITSRHTLKIDAKEKASPLKIAASIGGQKLFLPYSSDVIAIDFDFPDDVSRSVKISADKRAEKHGIDLYVLRKATEPDGVITENYVMNPAPYRRGSLYNKTSETIVNVTRQDVLFLVVSTDTLRYFASLKIEYSSCPDSGEKFCPPGAWGKGGCYLVEARDYCTKGLICIPYTEPCIIPGKKPFCASGAECESKKNNMNTDNEKEENGAQGSSSSPCLPGQSCFRW